MTNWKTLLLAVPFAAACLNSDEGIEEKPADDTSAGDTSEPDPIEAAAIGFELVAGWDQAAGELVGWTLEDGSTREPFVLLTLASMEYFTDGYDKSQTCELYANFVIDETADLLQAEIFDWNAGTGSSGTAVAPWENASFEGYLEIFAQSTETNCDNFDTEMYPLGGFLETFNLMHFGVAFADLGSSTHVRDGLFDEDRDGSISGDEETALLENGPSFMAQYVAINHPSASAEGGYDFIGYDWNYGVAYEMDTSTGDITGEPCEDDPETADVDESQEECLIPADLQANAGTNQVWISSGSVWLEDFPNIDLEGLQLGNGLSQ